MVISAEGVSFGSVCKGINIVNLKLIVKIRAYVPGIVAGRTSGERPLGVYLSSRSPDGNISRIRFH